MLCRLKLLISWSLPVLAVLVILGGPSQSAACAKLQVELKHRQEADKAKHHRPTQDSSTDTTPTDSSPGQPEAPAGGTKDSHNPDGGSSFGSFVVIKAAKPTDGPVAKVTLGLTGCPLFDSLKRPQPAGLIPHTVSCRTVPHHPPYLAQAPPASTR